jgi:very-short-patch-repair endonuclease
LGETLPALIPQVYLHYDPEVVSRVVNRDALLRQRMDFLLLFPGRQRIVIEIDGKQHYAEGDLASPRLYAEMVAADRELRLRGYEIYRFGGYELSHNRTPEVAVTFFERLFAAHRIT